jgi:hypothetical protein
MDFCLFLSSSGPAAATIFRARLVINDKRIHYVDLKHVDIIVMMKLLICELEEERK